MTEEDWEQRAKELIEIFSDDKIVDKIDKIDKFFDSVTELSQNCHRIVTELSRKTMHQPKI